MKKTRAAISTGPMNSTAPGSLIFVGEQKMEHPIIRMIQYDTESYHEYELDEIDKVFERMNLNQKNWINIDGLHDEKVVEQVGKQLNLDPLMLEDILDTSQRPKCEIYNGHLYLVLRMIRYDEHQDVTTSEQFSMVLGENYLFTFQEVEGDVLDSVRDRIRQEMTRIRTRTIGYLAYALIDTIVDNYIYSIEQFGVRIEEIDQEVLVNPKKEILEQINYYKKQVNYLRKVIRPVREAVFQFDKSEFVDKENKNFLKDLFDHVTIATESIETYRELLNEQLSVYHTNMSNKLNEIMRLLTIYSVIFIPLTFMVGVYGMNFKYFPELNYRYAYPVFWGVMIMLSVTMIVYFKRKKWL
ncbi:magnesium/cobalt transporter CorA [Reichenbachiella sp. MSK19-1]|uniref:magnesium/cobalt transporter CorA n=1 Tax=Reichenbachiella sp. MSK19-1 TaxID=1897631 RepID=UPI000E6CAA90|nr:magnesium/cobalt transporter CorA [Reichenbachiella sp. MSK19-1]RJE74766.1 magnesium and cobalt transport protein CorA [Reichenbachiella sp. MSK19-1]